MVIPTQVKLVYESMEQWDERFEEKSKIHPLQKDEEIEVKEDGSIKISPSVLDQMDWKVKTRLILVDKDIDLQQITLGKELIGEEAVKAMHKIAEGFY